MVVHQLEYDGLAAVGQFDLGRVELPALMHIGESETPIRRSWTFLRLRRDHTGCGEQTCQRGPRRYRIVVLPGELVADGQRARVPAPLLEVLADLQGLDRDVRADRTVRAATTRPRCEHLRDRLAGGLRTDLIEPRTRDPTLGAEPCHSPPRCVIGPPRDSAPTGHGNRTSCHSGILPTRPASVRYQQVGRAHVSTPVTEASRMPAAAWSEQKSYGTRV